MTKKSKGFGRWLHRQRQLRGWTLRTVEKRIRKYKVRLSDTHLCHIESGERNPLGISPKIIRGLILVYDLDANEMLKRLGFSAGIPLSFDDRSGRSGRRR